MTLHSVQFFAQVKQQAIDHICQNWPRLVVYLRFCTDVHLKRVSGMMHMANHFITRKLKEITAPEGKKNATF